MESKIYQIRIRASLEKVWDCLWNDETYRKWTAVFSPGSRAETDWQEGSHIYFLNGENQGMISKIQKKKAPELMIFKHLGIIDKNGKEELDSKKVEEWMGAYETYRLKPIPNGTLLEVEMHLGEDHMDSFDKTWPKALKILKKLAEQ